MGSKILPQRATCQRLDRDSTQTICGHPMPCPWHTVEIDVSQKRGTRITIPSEVKTSKKQLKRLSRIADALR